MKFTTMYVCSSTLKLRFYSFFKTEVISRLYVLRNIHYIYRLYYCQIKNYVTLKVKDKPVLFVSSPVENR